MKKLFTFCSILVLFQLCTAQDSTLTGRQLSPEDKHAEIAKFTAAALSHYHYRPQEINDAFSAKVFNQYIDNLDGNKHYFLASDIDDFSAKKNKYDNYLNDGELDEPYRIYNKLMERTQERLQFVYAYLAKEPDFTADDYYMIDREKANFAKDKKALDELWMQKLKFECLSLKVTGKKFEEYSETILKRYRNFEKQLLKTKSEDVFSIFMNSVTEVFDPHTNYFAPKAAADFNVNMSLSLEGIGATLRTENDYTKIVEVVKGGPADKSKKLFPEDKIVAVAQGKKGEFVDVIGWRIDDVVSLIRGPKGTVVKLKVLKADAAANAQPEEISLVREKIKLEDQAAKGTIKEVNRDGKKLKVGVVTLPTFYADFSGANKGEADYKSTTRDVRKIIEGFKTEGIDALIVDLRNNGGGSLKEAIDMTGLFIKEGPVVQVRSSNQSVKVEEDKDTSIVWRGPLTVLVNRFSASASEIFAAAIQDYGRGVIIGENTYGKGTVQNMVSLDDNIDLKKGEKAGELKLTIAKFYRVNGSSTQHKGVTPDIEFPSPYAADEFGEDASQYALPWDQISSSDYEKVADLGNQISELKKNHKNRMKNNAEFAYLEEDIKELEKDRKENKISVNEAKFKKEQDENEAKKKKREDERKKLSKEKPDLILDESLEIMCDMVTMK